MVNWEGMELEEIGLVASPSRETDADCVLKEGKEKEVATETLVLINNRNGNKILAVCRGGLGSNDSLRISYYNPGVAYARSGRGPSTAKEFYSFKLVVIGDVTDGEIKQNKIIIAPASPVYKFKEGSNPLKLFGKTINNIGYYATGSSSWRVPVLVEYIPHHIGVFGVTGSGKSFLCRYELIPLLRNAGYDVLIFDWKGSDYAPYYEDSVINMGDIMLDESSVYMFLLERLDRFGSGHVAEKLRDYLEGIILEGNWRGETPEETKMKLETLMKKEIEDENVDKSKKLTSWGERYAKVAQKYFNRLRPEDLRLIMGTMDAEQIINLLRQKKILVIDLSYGAKEQKLAIFLSIARHLKTLMEEKNKLNVAVLIDEAPQYCPWNPRGIEEETTRQIIGLAALGRSYGLSLTLVSQGIAGEIGINAAVRRNLNTLFIGRIHPLDAQEAEKFFASSWVGVDSLLRLPEGQFYLVGKMNPSPVPILISFNIEECEKLRHGKR
ncbi:MAG: ATP-binding protein [Nitrososphaerota archaeon]